MKSVLVALAVALGVTLAVPAAQAHHAEDYFWAGSGDREVQVVDSLTSDFTRPLKRARSNWSASTVLDVSQVRGSTGRSLRKKCPAVDGQVRMCDFNYGNNGWAGLAETWYNPETSRIVRATVRINTTYVKSSRDMNAVVCHELGHTLGLDHRSQSETSSCLTPRLDDGVNPDATDLQHLKELYTGATSSTSLSSTEDSVEADGAYMKVTSKVYPRR